jgi:hypothetical protein
MNVLQHCQNMGYTSTQTCLYTIMVTKHPGLIVKAVKGKECMVAAVNDNTCIVGRYGLKGYYEYTVDMSAKDYAHQDENLSRSF